MADSLKEVALAHMVQSSVPVSLSHSQPAQHVTSVLLNGMNFHVWSRSFQLYLGGKRKTRWILEKEPKPAESDSKFDEWILNTSPLPSLYEAFATVDGDERRHCLLPSLSLPESCPTALDQRAFAAASRTHPCLPYIASTVASLIAQLQSYLGLVPASPSFGPTATIVAETPTALHGKSGHPIWILDSGKNNHMTDSEIFAADNPIPPRPLPILEPPPPTPNGCLPPIVSSDPIPTLRLPSQHLLWNQSKKKYRHLGFVMPMQVAVRLH
ncbi:hypothetical protein Acr_05g0013890 [Actinidia rufa]|uniref:Retrotransposon Copia-like N-terminal domain-containing protein n=1 Tax=Actinidia rufa TaxID=165716 RepID=A0A7J0EN69_9ERIC|nr:hypothetical protein Acr_05g0013890 [Actinidia rufa]